MLTLTKVVSKEGERNYGEEAKIKKVTIVNWEMMGTKMAFLPMEGDGVGGSLCQGDGYKPTTDGAKIYLNGGEDLNAPLAKVEKAGGKVIMPKTKINDEIGFMAFFTDPEGNNMAFHSPK